MIISRTPFRISFFGGGTDYPAWYCARPGSVLATTINKYAYLSCRYLPPFFEHRIKVVWSKIECVKHWSEIQHPAARECLGFFPIEEGIEIHYDGDLPARSGLGSSSAFTVGLLHALHALQGKRVDKMQLARNAMAIERDRLGECVGSQDQVMVACGGFTRIDFSGNHDIRLRPIQCDDARLRHLQAHLMLVFTGFSRNAFDIAASQVEAIDRNARSLMRMHAMVDEGIALLESAADLDAFGAMLHEMWVLKRSLTSGISMPAIDDIYATARSAGAIGGKLLGAGGGGFMLLFARPECQPAVRKALSRLLYVPFAFETTGSQILFCGAEEHH